VGQRRHGKSKGFYFFYGKETEIINWEQDFFHHRTVSAVKRGEYVSDRMSSIVLRGRWFNINVFNVHTPSEEKSDDSKEFLWEIEAGSQSSCSVPHEHAVRRF